MKKVPVQEAVGMKLCHDMTKVIPGEFKGRAFCRNHIITQEDIQELLSIGKEHIYIWEENAGEIHEEDAAVRIAQAVMGKNLMKTEPEEGKSLLKTTIRGLLKVNSSLLTRLNSIEHVTIPSLPNNFVVNEQEKVASARIVPLVTQEENILKVEELCRLEGPVFEVKPFKKLKVGLVITGSEVYKGRIKDKFGPVIQEKLTHFEAEVIGQDYCPDDCKMIEKSIVKFFAQKADLILVTGGMSVDPDDLTPGAIRNTGARVITQGTPAQPGNMLMMAYLDEVPIFGVPGAAIYCKTTVLDVVLPRVFAGDFLTKEDFIRMGEGGLCRNCPTCHYPNCYFGR
ncbi:molybdopterin-binding protein [Desulfitobacterium sp. Sab5]|uniref:molybdopterin-binding protein n=1 Tax=Desulfitobacterium nosdiversum TaxID=3375356 RepID=UPI003CED8687